jgi:hypothetical protein
VPNPEGKPGRWLFAVCAACTAWLVVQNFTLLVLALGAWVRQ